MFNPSVCTTIYDLNVDEGHSAWKSHYYNTRRKVAQQLEQSQQLTERAKNVRFAESGTSASRGGM